MHVPFFSKGLHFECQRCSECCRGGPGFVYLSQQDVNRFSEFLHISTDVFISTYCRWVDLYDGREILSLIEKKNYDCIFWETGKGCTTYQARPLQCSAYPFWLSVLRGGLESWQSLAEHCPGVNCGKIHTAAEINECLEKREKEPYIIRNVTNGV